MATKKRKPVRKPPYNAGGQGGTILADPHHVRADLLLAARAAADRWPVTDETRCKVVAKAEELLEKGEERTQIAAMKVLATVDSINARREATEMGAKKPPGGSTYNTIVMLSPERLKTLSDDELEKLHTDTLGIPLQDPEPVPSGAGVGAVPSG